MHYAGSSRVGNGQAAYGAGVACTFTTGTSHMHYLLLAISVSNAVGLSEYIHESLNTLILNQRQYYHLHHD